MLIPSLLLLVFSAVIEGGAGSMESFFLGFPILLNKIVKKENVSVCVGSNLKNK